MHDDAEAATSASGHPIDKMLQQVFEDPAVTLQGELDLIREAWKGIETGAAANPQPRPGAANRTATVRPAPRMADRLIELARAAELFHTPDGIAFADVTVAGHRETWAVRGRAFGRWLARRFLEAERRAPAAEAVQQAARALETATLAGSPERIVHVRVGATEGRLYIDLGDAAWRAVEIDATGWRIVDSPPLRFRRPPHLRGLPTPEPGNSIDSLRGFLNVRSDEDLVTVAAWALAALRERGPYPVLVLAGEQGSAKSTCTAMLRALIDPGAARLRALPRDERELLAACQDNHVLAFDNLSAVPPWCADALCRLVSGGGFAPGPAGADGCAGMVGVARPVILNGIVDLMTRPDLADRALVLTLPGIASGERRPEAELWADFEAERPRLLGALLTAVAEGLRRKPETRLARLPRMADFALWATACETALWPAGTFEAAYAGNRDGAACDMFEADPVASALIAFLETRDKWEGTATNLLHELARTAGHATRSWPGNSRAFAGRLRQLAGALRSRLEIEVGFRRQSVTRVRIIRLTRNRPPSVLLTDPTWHDELRRRRNANNQPDRKP
jgi:hypothetical protein